MILYVALLEMVDREHDERILEMHKSYLKKHIDDGNIYAKGPFTDHSGGLVIYKAKSYNDAMELATNDPAVLQGTRKLTLKEWRSNVE